MTIFRVAITRCSIHQPEDGLLSLIMAAETFPGRYYTTLSGNPGSVGRSFFPCGSNPVKIKNQNDRAKVKKDPVVA